MTKDEFKATYRVCRVLTYNGQQNTYVGRGHTARSWLAAYAGRGHVDLLTYMTARRGSFVDYARNTNRQTDRNGLYRYFQGLHTSRFTEVAL